jgi:hypothetical protein
MAKGHGAMHVATVTSRQVDKAGQQREYQSHLVRRTFREGGKVKHQTLANITALPPAAIEAIRAILRGQQLAPVGQALQVIRSLPHGHAAAVWAQAKTLGLPALLGPAGRHRDLVLALIIARVLHPASKLATGCWWDDTTLGLDLGVAGASTDDTYAAMDWLLTRQDAIQAKLAKQHLAPAANPSRMALFDLSSSWMEGSCCPLAKRGYSRDGRKGTLQIEYGLLTDPAGCPVAITVFPGNTADPTAFLEVVTMVRDKFNLTGLVLVGDRGMITKARITTLRGDTGSGLGWLTALRAPAIKALAADGGPLQPTLFDEQDMAEISHPDYPGERLIACRNPYLAEERSRKRGELLHATEDALAPVLAAAAAGRLHGADRIGLRVGKIINKYKMAKHFQVTITDTTLQITRNSDQIASEAALDGIYVLRTSVSADQLDAAGVVTAYKNLANLERDFRSLKVDDLDLRPIYHRLEDRVRAHVFICMLAGYLTWHLRKTLAPLTFTDTQPPTRDNPVASATRSTAAERKASRHRDSDDNPIWSFRGLLDHLATLTRNQVRVAGTEHTVTILAEPTVTQQRVFELLNRPLPLTFK